MLNALQYEEYSNMHDIKQLLQLLLNQASL